MTEATDHGPGGAPDHFATFMRHLARGLETLIEGTCEVPPGEAITVRSDALARQFPGGALVSRTAWTTKEDGDGSGCFLWLGDFGALLGGGEKPAVGLTSAELESLRQSLRLNVQDVGEGDLALQWTEPEIVAAEELPVALREAGIPVESMADRRVAQFGGGELTFLFLAAPAAEPTAAGEAPPTAEPDPRREAPSAPPVASALGLADPEYLGGILDLPLSLQVRLGTTRMPLDDLLRLIPGSVIELQQREEEPLEVLANGRVVARGEVVVVDERFGIRITEIVNSRERLAAV